MEKIIEGKIKNITHAYKLVLFFMFGALWSFSLVGYSFSFLTWFTFVPFLFTIKYERYKSGFFYSWIFGLSVYLFHLWWVPVATSSIFFADSKLIILQVLSWTLSWLLNIFICAYHGMVYALVFLLARYISKRKTILFYFSTPVIFTVLDYFFPKIFHDQIGYSQYLFFHFSQIADIFGVSGITFLIMCCNSAVLIFIEAYLYKKNIPFGAMIFSGVILLIIASSLYGYFRYNYIVKIFEKNDKARIGLVQGNFSGKDKLDDNKIDDMINKYNKLSEKILKLNPDLIVWPETAVPIIYNINEVNYKKIKYFKESYLLTGIHLEERDKITNKMHFYNSAVLISKNGKKIDSYQKIKLLPFAEKFPLLLNLLGYEDFSAGKNFKVMEIDKIKLSPNICYEAIIPGFIRKSLNVNDKEANLIVNITNDSWFGRTIEPKIHFKMSGFRAIENRKSLIRATCTGYSVVFDPSGDIMYKSELFKEDFATRDIPLLEIKTFYRQWGWLFVWCISGFLLFILIFVSYRKIKFKYDKSRLISKIIHKKNLYRLWHE